MADSMQRVSDRALGRTGRQSIAGRDIEALADKPVDEMPAQGSLGRVTYSLSRGIGNWRCVQAICPVHLGLLGRRVLHQVAPEDGDRRQVVIQKQLVLVVADDDQDVGSYAGERGAEMRDRLLARIPARLGLLGRNLTLEVLILPNLQELRVCDIPPLIEQALVATVSVRPHGPLVRWKL